MHQKFYQVGGSLPPDIPSYIKRKADTQLYNYLKDKKYCYVLNARQVGKSSLRIRTSKRLEKEGHICVNIDVTSIGSNDISPDEWYFSLLDSIIEQLYLEEDDFAEWWDENINLTVVNRFAKAFDRFVIDLSEKSIFIFIDEVDSILGVDNFSTDDFFAVIRTFYNLRGENPKYNQVTFALFGVATPEDLMRDSSRTPFNIANSVTINSFKFEESLSLMEGLKDQTIDTKQILERVFFYTDGMPYLTQKILEYISENPIKEIKDIEKIIGKLFIKEGTNEKNLRNVQKRIINNKEYSIKMLTLIARILQGELIKANDGDLRHIYLKLSGLVKNKNGVLKYSNRIYERVFSKTWLKEQSNKIDRPFLTDLNRWIDLNRDKSALLKGEVLIEAKNWAEEREDLTPSEQQYLTISTDEEYRVREKRKRAKEKVKIEKEKKKSHLKVIRILAYSSFIILIFLGITIKFYFDAIEQKEELKKQQEKLKEQKEKLKTQKELAEKQEKIAIEQKELAEINRKLAEEKSKIAEEKSKKLESAKTIIKSSTCNQETHKQDFYRNKIDAFKTLLDDNPILYKNNIVNTLKDLTNTCIKSLDIEGAEESYKELIISNLELEEENNISSFRLAIADISKNIGDLYREKNQTDKIESYYRKALDIYLQNPIRDNLKIANIYYLLGDLYLKKRELEQAKAYHTIGFEIYKPLLPEETQTYLPKLAERFLWLAQWSSYENRSKESVEQYNKALRIYRQLKKDQPNRFKNEIGLIKRSLRKLPRNNRNKKPKIGSIYIGEIVDGKWKKQFLGFKKESFSTPTDLESTEQIAINEINVRVTTSSKAKVINGIDIGNSIKINKIRIHQGGYVWAEVSY